MIRLTIYGHPVPQGSSRAFTPKGWKRPIITSASPNLKPWRQAISETAQAVVSDGAEAFHPEIPLFVQMDFYLERPKSAPRKRVRPTVKPDGDKLVRAVFDGCTGILFGDDAQIVDHRARKFYGVPERVEITITEAE